MTKHKFILWLFVLIGVTFVYCPSTKEGFVFVNTSDNHAVIFVEPSTNTVYFYEMRLFATGKLNESVKELSRSYGNKEAIINPVNKLRGKEF